MDATGLPHVLILAAGSSSRMRGADKLLIGIDGIPQIRRIAQAALTAAVPVHVVIGPLHEARRKVLENLPVNVITASLAGHGMAESLKAGLRALPSQSAVLLLLADLPDIAGDDIAAMVAAHLDDPTSILRGATSTGHAGHPVLLPAWLRPDILELQGDAGARKILARHKAGIRLIQLGGAAATTDLDTPEDWKRWQALRQ